MKQIYKNYNGACEYCCEDDDISMERVKEDRNRALQELIKILNQYGFGDEFITVFVEYCNFYILTGMYQRFAKEAELELDEITTKEFGFTETNGLYDLIRHMEDANKKIQYLEYIRKGIYENNAPCFSDAIQLYEEYNMPFVYGYLILFQWLVANEIDALETEEAKENFIYRYEQLERYRKHIKPDFFEQYIKTNKVLEGEECKDFLKMGYCGNVYLPCLNIGNYTEMVTTCMRSDLEKMAQYGGVNKIETSSSFFKAYVNIRKLDKSKRRMRKYSFLRNSSAKNSKIKYGLRKFVITDINRKKNYCMSLNSFFKRIPMTKYSSRIFDFDEALFDREESFLSRQYYLKLKMLISQEGFKNISIAKEMKLAKDIKELNRKRNDMMDYYAHSWKHISYPQIVKEIAEELGDSNRILANRLMKVYNSECTLQRGIQLLQYISSDDEQRVRREFRNGMMRSGVNREESAGIFEVLCSSLDLVIFKLLMAESDDSERIRRCREKWNEIKSLSNLREEYTRHFLEKNSVETEIVDWVSDNFLNLEIQTDDAWNTVRFRKDSFAVNQFKEICVEIFTNVFLHGEEYLKLDLSSNETEMIFSGCNRCSDTTQGGQSGISTMSKLLELLNQGTDIDGLETDEADGEYKIVIRLDKKLLIRKGR